MSNQQCQSTEGNNQVQVGHLKHRYC